MDDLPALGTSIPGALPGTFKIYGDLQTANKAAILAISPKEHSYGPHPRQNLDLYVPPNSSGDENDGPILIFLYGGGLERGDKIMSHPPGPEEGLTYKNIGAYFASHNITTILPDYRRVRPDEQATFPSGGEDVDLTLQWVSSNLKSKSGKHRDVYLMGNSAGGVHLFTYVLAPRFQESVAEATSSGDSSIYRIAGMISVSTPMSFGTPHPSRAKVLEAYYHGRAKEDSPLGLLKALEKKPEGVKLLVVNGSLDPESEILAPCRPFVQTWQDKFGNDGLEEVLLDGHNHFSPVLGLSTGIEKEEILGQTVLKFMGVSQ